MTNENDETLTFKVGDVKSLPHTLSLTRHLTLSLLAINAVEGTADFEFRNPEAEPDEMVGGLIEESRRDVERSNHWRDDLHLPEKTVPVDASTEAVELIHARLHEKLQIGDRVWSISEIAADSVTLVPGHDHEAHTVRNAAEDVAYQPEAIAVEERLSGIDGAI